MKWFLSRPGLTPGGQKTAPIYIAFTLFNQLHLATSMKNSHVRRPQSEKDPNPPRQADFDLGTSLFTQARNSLSQAHLLPSGQFNRHLTCGSPMSECNRSKHGQHGMGAPPVISRRPSPFPTKYHPRSPVELAHCVKEGQRSQAPRLVMSPAAAAGVMCSYCRTKNCERRPAALASGLAGGLTGRHVSHRGGGAACYITALQPRRYSKAGEK